MLQANLSRYKMAAETNNNGTPVAVVMIVTLIQFLICLNVVRLCGYRSKSPTVKISYSQNLHPARISDRSESPGQKSAAINISDGQNLRKKFFVLIFPEWPESSDS